MDAKGKIKIFGKGWNFSQDGPGNRLLYHFQGCNLTCPWCSNPEGMSMNGTLLFKADKAVDSVCPYGAIANRQLDRNVCNSCPGHCCLQRNRNEGVAWSAKEYAIDEIVTEVENARGLFHSGGGVTITGGEPTLQFALLKELLYRLKSRKISTVVETNGTTNKLSELFPLIDTLIIDLKHTDTNIHKSVLGLGNEQSISNIKEASESGSTVWVRIPLIPGFNDDEKFINEAISLISGINREKLSVELLPYHEYGKVKWQQTGKVYTMPDRKVDPDRLKKYKQLFLANNMNLINT